jgi:hypothetical protein
MNVQNQLSFFSSNSYAGVGDNIGRTNISYMSAQPVAFDNHDPVDIKYRKSANSCQVGRYWKMHLN